MPDTTLTPGRVHLRNGQELEIASLEELAEEMAGGKTEETLHSLQSAVENAQQQLRAADHWVTVTKADGSTLRLLKSHVIAFEPSGAESAIP